MVSLLHVLNQAKPFLAVAFMQFSYAVMSVIAKFAFNQGMSPHVLVAYRMAFASAAIAPFAIVIERKSRPKMTLAIFTKIALISLLEPVLDHNFYYTGLKYTTATFTAAMTNVLPALTFALACIFKQERVEIKRVYSQAKVVGTIVSVGGAMMMTFIKGPILKLPWTKDRTPFDHSDVNGAQKQDMMKGTLMIITGCCCWSCFIISQAGILKSYPAKLSLTALYCITAAVEATIIAFVVEWHDKSVWLIHFHVKFIAALYGGMVTAFALYTMGSVTKIRGPVFVSAFGPLNMVIVAILGSFVLAEVMHLGSMMGSIVIVIGLYLVLWGKTKDRAQSKPDTDGTEAADDQEMGKSNDGKDSETPDPEFETIDSNRP